MRHHLNSTIKPFIGKKLRSITREGDNAAIVLFEDGTRLQIQVDGDCCSHSIFYAIEVPESLIGAELEDVIEGSYPEDSESVTSADSEEEALKKVEASGIDFYPEDNSVWNVVLKTNKGNALLRHINSSNGYYDGDTSYTTL